MIILECGAWDGFLSSEIFPLSYRCPTNPFEVRNVDFYRAILPQINLTNLNNLPLNLEGLIASHNSKGLPFLNSRLFDISKAYIHNSIQARFGQKLGLETLNSNDIVIVKSNLNFGGELERKNIKSISSTQKNLIPPDNFTANSYYLSPLKDVPKHILDSPIYSVEKYVSNSKNRFYRCYVGGENLIVVEAYSDDLIKKIGTNKKNINYLLMMEKGKLLEKPDYLPPQLLNTIMQTIDLFEIDYAAVDIVCDDDEDYFVIDINTTPSCGNSPLQKELCEFLFYGVEQRVQNLMAKLS